MAAVDRDAAPPAVVRTPAAKRRKANVVSPSEQRSLLSGQLARQLDEQQRQTEEVRAAAPPPADPRPPDASVTAKR
jgi:hypothetical protein